MFGSDDLLAAISQHLLVPDNRFEKTLQRASCDILLQCDRFRILALHVEEESSDINFEQCSAGWPSKTICKSNQKLTEQFAQL